MKVRNLTGVSDIPNFFSPQSVKEPRGHISKEVKRTNYLSVTFKTFFRCKWSQLVTSFHWSLLAFITAKPKELPALSLQRMQIGTVHSDRQKTIQRRIQDGPARFQTGNRRYRAALQVERWGLTGRQGDNEWVQ